MSLPCGRCLRLVWVGGNSNSPLYKSSKLCCGSTGEPRLCSFFSPSHTVRLSGRADLYVLNGGVYQGVRLRAQSSAGFTLAWATIKP